MAITPTKSMISVEIFNSVLRIYSIPSASSRDLQRSTLIEDGHSGTRVLMKFTGAQLNYNASI